MRLIPIAFLSLLPFGAFPRTGVRDAAVALSGPERSGAGIDTGVEWSRLRLFIAPGKAGAPSIGDLNRISGDAGFRLFHEMAGAHSRYGCWGQTGNVLNPETPKCRAVRSLARVSDPPPPPAKRQEEEEEEP